MKFKKNERRDIVKKEKGFTLIELLAVIIVLAVIALIATPIVLNVIDSSRRSAFESSVYGIIDAIRLKTMEDKINNESLIKEYTFPSQKIEVQGEQPKGGISKVDKDGRITVAIYNEKWCATKGYNEGTIIVKDHIEGECTLPSEETSDDEVVLTGTAIVEKVKPLVYDENGACKTDGTTYQYMGGCYIKAEPSTTLANHIWYNGFLWRIMGINSDGSIRMITEENVTSIPYNVAKNTNFDGSHADKWLNEYFYGKLSNENNLRNIIVSGTFCQGEATTSSPSRTDCTNGTELTRNIGLLSIDEYNLSGGSSSYLKNAQFFWTMSPYNSSNAWYVSSMAARTTLVSATRSACAQL